MKKSRIFSIKKWEFCLPAYGQFPFIELVGNLLVAQKKLAASCQLLAYQQVG